MNRIKSIIRLSCLLLICSAAHLAFATVAGDLVLSRSGNLPILLTAPHGGTASVSGVATRGRGTTVTDTYTIEIVEALAKQLETALGAQPYVVAARFSRKYIDANRAEAEAFDAPDAKPAYDAYHNQIRQFLAQIRDRFPKGAVLLDIHGQSDDPEVAHRGTRNGATVSKLIRAHGAAALTGPSSIFGALQSKGYKVFPPNTPIGDPPENRRFNGGFTVHTYGSGGPEGIDAIQIEVGRYLRTESRFVTALGESIVVFYSAYLTAQ